MSQHLLTNHIAITDFAKLWFLKWLATVFQQFEILYDIYKAMLEFKNEWINVSIIQNVDINIPSLPLGIIWSFLTLGDRYFCDFGFLLLKIFEKKSTTLQ